MCLIISESDTKKAKTNNKPVKRYKILRLEKGKLVSRYYVDYEWKIGENKSNYAKHYGNEVHEGIHVFVSKDSAARSPHYANNQTIVNEVILEVICDPKDLIAVGSSYEPNLLEVFISWITFGWIHWANEEVYTKVTVEEIAWKEAHESLHNSKRY
jgi:hypothetical protein